ncbi:hypothetical protein V5O48_016238, partial [Marasmius crinis-equi]
MFAIARGFDPATTEFAQHNGYSMFDIEERRFPEPSHFERSDLNPEANETSPLTTHGAERPPEPEDFSLGILFGDTELA